MAQQSQSGSGSGRGGRHAPLAIVALGVAILLAAGVASWWWLSRATVAPAWGAVQTVRAGDLQVTARIDDLAIGPRVVELLVYDSAGQPADVETVQLRFSMAEMAMAEVEADARPAGAGLFRAQGSFFTMAGRWQLDATLMRAGEAPVRAPFVFAIAAPGEASGPANPLAPDAPTLNAGRLLYQANCLICHGANGAGDGPAAVGLSPGPADFTQHMLPGKHTDGQVFLWIRDGVPGSAMPGWGQRLSEEQLWQLVTYLRTFGRSAAPPTAQAAPPASQPVATTPAQPSAVPPAPATLPPLVLARQGNLWRSDGTGGLEQLTHLGADRYAAQPAISPGRDRIAFVTVISTTVTASSPLPASALYVMGADGANLRALWQPARGLLALPSWAVDGQSIYVGIYDILSAPDAPVTERLFRIIQVDLASGTQRTVLENARDPALAPGGTQLAYVHYDPAYATFALHIAAPDGSGDRELTRPGAFSTLSSPRFSPDGKRIVFASVAGPATDPQGFPLTGSRRSPLDQLLALLEPPAAAAHGPLSELWLVNSDGTGLRRIMGVQEDTPMAIFSPDGRLLVVMGAGGIYLVNPDGSQLRKIDVLGDHGGLDWAGP
jgi:mono/diheme cytochrome c family protein